MSGRNYKLIVSNNMPTVNRLQTLFVGIDVHKDTHTAVAISPFGEKVFEMKIGNEAEDFISLIEKTKVEASRAGLIPSFGLEDVHSWGERLSSFLVEEGLPVRAVAPILVDHRRSKTTHPEKNDSLDAQGVAEVMIQRIDSLPLYKLTEEAQKAKQIRELSLEREWLVKERSRLKNQLHSLDPGHALDAAQAFGQHGAGRDNLLDGRELAVFNLADAHQV